MDHVTLGQIVDAASRDLEEAALWAANGALSLAIAVYCLRGLVQRHRTSPLWLRLCFYAASAAAVWNIAVSPYALSWSQVVMQAGIVGIFVNRYRRHPHFD